MVRDIQTTSNLNEIDPIYHIETEIEIERSCEEVWRVFRSFDTYGEWNPFIQELGFEPGKSDRLNVLMHPPGGKPMWFKPQIKALEEGRRLVWLGHLLVPKVFDGEHYFELEPLGEDRCRFVQGERFTGVLVPFLRKMLDTQTRAGFDAMNQALKERVESGSTLEVAQ